MQDIKQELETLIKARYPLIMLETSEESRAVRLIAGIAVQQKKTFLAWAVTTGLCKPMWLKYFGCYQAQEEIDENNYKNMAHIYHPTTVDCSILLFFGLVYISDKFRCDTIGSVRIPTSDFGIRPIQNNNKTVCSGNILTSILVCIEHHRVDSWIFVSVVDKRRQRTYQVWETLNHTFSGCYQALEAH